MDTNDSNPAKLWKMVHIPCISHEMTMVSINSTGHNWSIVVSVEGDLGILDIKKNV